MRALMKRTRPHVLLTLVFALASCVDSADVELLAIDATGFLSGLAFLDNNGNGQLDAGDERLEDVTVHLTAGVGGQVIQEAQTDTAGVFEMRDVPVGAYSLGLDRRILGDSLEAVAVGTDNVVIRRDDETRVNLGVSFPVLTVEEVRETAAGRRVFTTGIALNPRQSFGDGLVHIRGDSLYLRATNVERGSLNTGDSVRFLGRVRMDAGQPILDEVTSTVLVNLATIPVPAETRTGTAATANGGPLDAALARVRDAEITDTATVNGDFLFTVDDGSGPLRAVIRSFLQPTTTGFRPDTVVWARELTGLLVPTVDAIGQVRWRILLRGPSDVRLENKLVDVALQLSADSAMAQAGSEVVIRLVARNLGQVRATNVQISDTIPSGLSVISATATRGTYSSGTSLWVIDTLKTTKADTLTIRATVAGGAPASIVNRAWVGVPVYEIDTNPFNNSASVTIETAAPSSAANVRWPRMDRGATATPAGREPDTPPRRDR